MTIIPAKFDPHKVKQSRITEVLVQTIQADSPKLSFWHTLAPSVPFEVFDVLNYIFHFYVIICDHHIYFQEFLTKTPQNCLTPCAPGALSSTVRNDVTAACSL